MPTSKKKSVKKTAKKKTAKKKVIKSVKKPPRTTLTPKEARFVQEYLIDLNGTQAAIRAGYSKKSARVIACDLLMKPYIKAIIQAAADKRSVRTKITQDRVLEELARIAFVDIREAFTKDGSLHPIHNMPEDVARAIGGLDLSSSTDNDGAIEYTKKIKLIDKKGSLELLGRHLSLFKDKVEHTFKYEDMSDEELNRKIMSLESQKDQGLRD